MLPDCCFLNIYYFIALLTLLKLLVVNKILMVSIVNSVVLSNNQDAIVCLSQLQCFPSNKIVPINTQTSL